MAPWRRESPRNSLFEEFSAFMDLRDKLRGERRGKGYSNNEQYRNAYKGKGSGKNGNYLLAVSSPCP